MRLGTPEKTRLYVPDAQLSVGNGAKKEAANGTAEPLSAVEQESLLLNIDASFRVHSRPHFFSWTQGLLQNLIKHEVLMCALRSGGPLSFSVDTFAMNVADPEIVSDAFLRDAPVTPVLIRLWEEYAYRPVTCEVGDLEALAGGSFARELQRIGATRLVIHGTHNCEGVAESFFIFACVPGTDTDARRQAYLTQLLVPFLHSAWIRTRLNAPARSNETPKPARTGNITPREQEILKWIYLGKSNFEIGAILAISPLTVKNHVQKILRKLNVVNRAQAVGKALELRILNV